MLDILNTFGVIRAFFKISAAKTYVEVMEINKLECIDHVQKRIGFRLRRLLKEKWKIILE